jgi:hypothetical protein
MEDADIKLFSTILRRVEYPVEAFGFIFPDADLPTPVSDGVRNSLGKEPGLLYQPVDSREKWIRFAHSTQRVEGHSDYWLARTRAGQQ